MPDRNLLITLLILLLCNNRSLCQQNDAAYIKENLNIQSYSIDSEASAVVLFEKYTIDIGTDYLQKETVHKIIRILRSDATNLANVSVFFPADDYKNYVSDIEGTTYNLDGDKIVTTLLKKEDKFKKSIGNNLYQVDFTMPEVKEGSIIEYSYVIGSKINFLLPIWHIQDQYPKLVSEYQLYCPNNYGLTSISRVNEKVEQFPTQVAAEQSMRPFCHARTNFWIRRNIDAIKAEPFVTNLNQEKERLEIQISGFANVHFKADFANTWDKANTVIWKRLENHKVLPNSDNLLKTVVDSISATDTSEEGKIRSIYSYVRSRFRYKQDKFYSDKSLFDIFNSKEGNVIDINMLLFSMLSYAGINVRPVLLSTTNNLPLNNSFPVVDRINYLVCAAFTRDSSVIYLDASDKNNIYGMLPYYCYNGFAWMLGDKGQGINLSPNMIEDKATCGVTFSNFNDTSAKLEIVEKIGLIQSQILRNKWNKDEKAKQQYVDERLHSFSSNIVVQENNIANEKSPDTNLVFRYSCVFKLSKSAGSYFINSVFLNFLGKNPFTATQRKLPIEFPYKRSYKYFMNITLPEYLVPDTLFEPSIINYDNGSITYKKVVNYSPDMHLLTLNVNYNENSTYYAKDYYETMRELYQKMIRQSEDVLILKKNIKK